MKITPVDALTITVLVDNYTDVLLESTESVKRPPRDRNGRLAPLPLAEHGLSLLVESRLREHTGRLLLDAGASPRALLYNAEILGIDLASVNTFVLSHGHHDHHGGLEHFLSLKRRERVTVLAHPDAFGKKYHRSSGGVLTELPHPDRQAIIESGADIVLRKQPSQVSLGLIATGEVERSTDFEKGQPSLFTEREGEIVQDLVLDDQALVACVADKGLVIVAGCAHAGIVNTVKYARKITGIDRVYAVMGGFHLSGANESVILETAIELKQIAPQALVPMHCTGWGAMNCLADIVSESFVLCTVGTKINL